MVFVGWLSNQFKEQEGKFIATIITIIMNYRFVK